MNAKVLTNQPKTRKQWLDRLENCQRKILELQNKLLDALPAGASLSFLSRLNEQRELLIKNLEQIDNFRYQLTLQDRQQRQSDSEEARYLAKEIKDFFVSFDRLEKNLAETVG